MNILVTGAAGFIGSQLCHSLLLGGDEVVGIDNMSPCYGTLLKDDRIENLNTFKNFHFFKMSVLDKVRLGQLFQQHSFECVVHLAALAGVRYSYLNPADVLSSNISGMISIIEQCRKSNISKFIYASSSSVYGDCNQRPFREDTAAGKLLSPYAFSKQCCEDIAQSYCYIYGVSSIGLRFFTVYGPWGRPDMAPMIFANALKNNSSISLYNNGQLVRDFTYIDDVINGIECAVKCAGEKDFIGKHVIYNIGRGEPILVKDFLSTLEHHMGKSAIIVDKSKPIADVEYTHAEISKAKIELGFEPSYSIEDGIPKFVEWFNSYYCNK